MNDRLYPYARRTIEIDGHAMAYVDEGNGPPVVMVHGNPTWGFAFRELIAGLVGRHRVIVPDHIGMGRSSRPDAGSYSYTLSRRMQDLGVLLDRLVPEGPVDLVLHDWGGAIGGGWATRNPERVGHLLLLNTVAFPLPDDQPLPWLLRLARSRTGTWMSRHVGVFSLGTIAIGARRRLPLPIVRGYLAPYRSASDRTGIVEFVRDIPIAPDDPAWHPLAETAELLPTLAHKRAVICWGMRDPVFTPALLSEWRRRLPGIRIVKYPRAGHLVLEDAGPSILAIATELFDAEATVT